MLPESSGATGCESEKRDGEWIPMVWSVASSISYHGFSWENMGNGIPPESQKCDFGTRSLKLGDRPDKSAIIGSQYNVPRFVV
jgi:hypothetical protein